MRCDLTLMVTRGTGAGGSARAASTVSAPAPTSRALMEMDWRRRRIGQKQALEKIKSPLMALKLTCWAVEG